MPMSSSLAGISEFSNLYEISLNTSYSFPFKLVILSASRPVINHLSFSSFIEKSSFSKLIFSKLLFTVLSLLNSNSSIFSISLSIP